MNRTEQSTASLAHYYDAMWERVDDFIKFNPGARHRRRITMSILRKLDFEKVLDVGCGNAEMLLDLNRSLFRSISYTGTDISPAVIETNRKTFSKSFFQELDIEKQTLNEQFDIITCCEVIEHLWDRESAFKNLSAMLTQGGYLLISCPTGKIYATEKAFGHTTHPNKEELEHLASVNGLQLVKLYTWGWPTYKALKEIVNINPQKSLLQYASTKYTLRQKLVCNFLFYLNYFNFFNSIYGCQIFCLMKKCVAQ